jgi:hypothetical protein
MYYMGLEITFLAEAGGASVNRARVGLLVRVDSKVIQKVVPLIERMNSFTPLELAFYLSIVSSCLKVIKSFEDKRLVLRHESIAFLEL